MEIFEQDKDYLYSNNESKMIGMFPFGKGGFWHSGIHLHIDSPITLPLEGEVVAYHIADKYQANSKGKNVSKSFILIKHNVSLMKGAENTENSKIEFFSLYTSLLPDSELKVCKEFNDFKELTNTNKNLNLPFYKDVQVSLNLEKCSTYKKLKDGNYFAGTMGNVIDSSYLTERKLNSKVNIQLGNSSFKLPSSAIKLEDSTKSYEVKVKKDNTNYFPTLTESNIFFPRGTVAKGTTFNCDSEPIVVNSENYYKIKSRGGVLKNNEKTGYIFQSETYKNTPSSDYAYVQKELKYSVLYDVIEIENRKDFFFICKYSDLKKYITDINNLKGFKAFLANIGFGITKDTLNKDISENISTDATNKEFKDDDLIFICNNEYPWNKSEKSKNNQNTTFYDISFKEKISSYAIFYFSKKVFDDISKNVKENTENSVKLVELNAIKENNKQFSCAILNENAEIDKKNNINLLTNNLLYKVKTHLPSSYDTEWLIKGGDLELIKGPSAVLVDDGVSFTNTSKGLMLYDKNNQNNPSLLLEKISDCFSVSDYKSFIENTGSNSQIISYNGNEYYVKIQNIEQLKVKVINKSGFNVNQTIKASSENNRLFLSKGRILGFASENGGEKSFDFITFTKDVDFFKTKDSLIIRTPKENSEIHSVEKIKKTINQKLPYESVLKITGKEEILGHYYYKVKYYLMPLWFDSNNLTAAGKKYTIKSNLYATWISRLRINSDGSTVNSNVWANNQEISILIDLVNKNFESLKGQTYDFIEKNSDATSSSLAVNFETMSAEYFIEDISNFTLDEKAKTLTIKERSAVFTLYESIPYLVNKVNDSSKIKSICDKYSCDEGTLLKYQDTEYYALVKKDSSSKTEKDYYIKKTDIEEKNLLDWNNYFRVYDKDSDDDVYYDLKDVLDSCGIEENVLSDLKNKLDGKTGKNKKQQQLIEIYSNNEAKNSLRKLIAKHPLEFNEELYKEDEIKKIIPIESEAKNFVNDMKLVSFWKDIPDNQKTDLFFSHPVTFFNHVDEIKDNAVPFLYEKWGSRITGRNGNIFILDNGKGRLLSNVEWYSQRDNAGDSAKGVYGWNMCQLTSLAMVMNAMGIKRKRSDCQFEDELYNIANLAGYGGSKIWEETSKVYNEVLLKYTENYDYVSLYLDTVIENTKIELIKKQIEAGVPVLKSMEYKEDGDSGHVIVVVGYIDDCFIVNDPYGDVNTGYTEHNGAFVSYKTNRWWFTKKWAGILD